MCCANIYCSSMNNKYYTMLNTDSIELNSNEKHLLVSVVGEESRVHMLHTLRAAGENTVHVYGTRTAEDKVPTPQA